MNYYLIDYENVHNDGVKELNDISAGDVVAIFYTDHCKNITLDTIGDVLDKDAKLMAFRALAGTKNALDFQLSYYIGYLVGTDNNKDARYYIVSNDKGYDCLCEYLREQGIDITRMPTKSEPAPASKPATQAVAKGTSAKATAKATAAAPTNKTSKVKASDMATLGEMEKILTKDEKPAEVLKIFNQYKTKCDINNGLVKKFKSSKKAGKIYRKLKDLLKEKNKL